MVSGSIVLHRWGRWETCIDFSFCWGKQACCSWARVQWGRQNVLDCSSSLSLMSCDCYETPWTQLIPQNRQKHSQYLPFIFLLWVIIYLIFNQSKKSCWRQFWRICQSRQLYTILVHAGWKFMSNTWRQMKKMHHSSPVLVEEPHKEWMNGKHDNLCEPHLVCSAETMSSSSLLHTRWSLKKKTSDSYQHLYVPVLSDFAGEDADLILGHNLQCILANVPVVVGQNKIFTTHSGTWQGLEAFAVGSLPE